MRGKGSRLTVLEGGLRRCSSYRKNGGMGAANCEMAGVALAWVCVAVCLVVCLSEVAMRSVDAAVA